MCVFRPDTGFHVATPVKSGLCGTRSTVWSLTVRCCSWRMRRWWEQTAQSLCLSRPSVSPLSFSSLVCMCECSCHFNVFHLLPFFFALFHPSTSPLVADTNTFSTHVNIQVLIPLKIESRLHRLCWCTDPSHCFWVFMDGLGPQALDTSSPLTLVHTCK